MPIAVTEIDSCTTGLAEHKRSILVNQNPTISSTAMVIDCFWEAPKDCWLAASLQTRLHICMDAKAIGTPHWSPQILQALVHPFPGQRRIGSIIFWLSCSPKAALLLGQYITSSLSCFHSFHEVCIDCVTFSLFLSTDILH